MKSIYIIGLAVLVCTTTGCCTKRLKGCQNLKADDPKIIEFANRCATTCSSFDLTTFEQPVVKEYPEQWRIFYQDKASANGYRAVGRHFTVIIDKKICKGEVFGGL